MKIRISKIVAIMMIVLATSINARAEDTQGTSINCNTNSETNNINVILSVAGVLSLASITIYARVKEEKKKYLKEK